MPYVTCPTCDTSVYTAARFSTTDECPQCGTALRRNVHEPADGRVSAFTKSSSWPVVQHSNASQ
jgi:endogenous inhibitor of DNA gyrase (YacG/DUF329 family)